MLKIVQENDALKASKEDLADGDDRYVIRYSLISNNLISEQILYSGEFATTWNEMFRCIADVLYTEIRLTHYSNDWGTDKLFSCISELIQTKEGARLGKFKTTDPGEILPDYYIKIDESDLATIMRQFEALGLIESKDYSYSLTAKGKSRYLQMVALKKK